MKVQTPVGVLVMAYGGPNSLDEVRPYLMDVRGHRPTPEHVVEAVRQRYAAIEVPALVLSVVGVDSFYFVWMPPALLVSYLGLRRMLTRQPLGWVPCFRGQSTARRPAETM